MAASRDDFVIAIRSAFIKKGNKQRFSLIGLCLLYTSDAADEEDSVDLGGRRIIKKKR